MKTRGRFISFEGGEGCGKSTQVKLLSEALTARGIDHIVTREPGGTDLAEKIRPLLVERINLSHGERSQSPSEALGDAGEGPLPKSEISTSPSGRGDSTEDWHPLAETLLFLAARVQHVKIKIEPALKAGKWVICDRFTDSTLTYQGVGKGLEIDYLWKLQQSLLGDFAPDQTFLLDISPEIGLKRAASRHDGEDRFEQLDIQFHQKLRQGFLTLAEAETARFTIIDADQPIDAIHQQIISAF